MRTFKKFLSILITLSMVLNLNLVSVIATEPETIVEEPIVEETSVIEFDPYYGEFVFADGNDWATVGEVSVDGIIGDGFSEEFASNMTVVRSDGVGLEGWLEFRAVWGTDGDGNSYIEDYDLVSETVYSTSEVLNRKVPDEDTIFTAKWEDLDPTDYYKYVEYGITSYEGFYVDKTGNSVRSHEQSGLPVGIPLSTYNYYAYGADYVPIQEDPEWENGDFEGWLAFAYTYKEGSDNTEKEYSLVSDTLYTTQQMLELPIPSYNVIYTAKWSTMDIDEYYYAGEWYNVYLDGNDGTIEYEVRGEKGTDSAYSIDLMPNKSLEDSYVSIKDPVYWDSDRVFQGWEGYKEVRIYDEESNEYYWDTELLKEGQLFSTAEVLSYEVTDAPLIFYAMWEGDDSDYYTDIIFDAYTGKIPFQSYDYVDGEKVYWGDIEYYETSSYSGKPGLETIQAVLDAMYEDVRGIPVREDAEFEG